MRFAISPNDPRLAVLVGALDHDGLRVAETWRRVSEAAERMGMRRPSYQHVRRLVCVERRRRELERAGRAVLGQAASAMIAGRVPSAVWTLERLRDLQAAEDLVLQEHKAFSAGARDATGPGRRSRGP